MRDDVDQVARRRGGRWSPRFPIPARPDEVVDAPDADPAWMTEDWSAPVEDRTLELLQETKGPSEEG